MTTLHSSLPNQLTTGQFAALATVPAENDGENLTDRRYIATQTGGIKTLGQPLLILGGLRIHL